MGLLLGSLFLCQYLWGFLFNIMGPQPVCVNHRASRSRPPALTTCQSFFICGGGSLDQNRLQSPRPAAGAAHDSGKQRPEAKHQYPCLSQSVLCKDLQQLPQYQDLSTLSTQGAGLDLELNPVKTKIFHVSHGFKPDTSFGCVMRTYAGLSRPKEQVWDQNLALLRPVQPLGAFH